MIARDRLAAAAWEADQHAHVLGESLADWHRQPAPDLPTLQSDRGKVRLVDQLLFRFIKLQDVMGERLSIVVILSAAKDLTRRVIATPHAEMLRPLASA
ncbi:MAG: hypothetical protein ACYCZI_03070 [Metallibacterium scheffleri]